MKKKAKKKQEFKHGDVSFEIEAKPKVVLDCDLERFSNGFLHMAITEIKIGQDGKDLGAIRVDVQGAAVHGIIGSRTWSISMKELWPLFQVADEKYMQEAA